MKTKIFSMVFAMLMLCASLTTVFAIPQGTNGDELHVVEAQELEIQLGTEWSGVEFMLRTDAGVYPGTITVNDNGVLSLEIGGSKKYTLSCLHSSSNNANLTLLQAPVTNEPLKDKTVSIEDNNSAIPISHIIMFVGGIVIAVGILIAIYISGKNREIVQDDEENDDF